MPDSRYGLTRIDCLQTEQFNTRIWFDDLQAWHILQVRAEVEDFDLLGEVTTATTVVAVLLGEGSGFGLP